MKKKEDFLFNRNYFFIYTDKEIRFWKFENEQFKEQKEKDAINLKID